LAGASLAHSTGWAGPILAAGGIGDGLRHSLSLQVHAPVSTTGRFVVAHRARSGLRTTISLARWHGRRTAAPMAEL
jgi:hypothetical protein